jgi:phenylacetate-CoA ligase
LSIAGTKEFLSSLKSLRLSKEELGNFQARRLRAQMRFIFQRVPYYHQVMKESGLSPDDFQLPEDLHKLPLLTKEIISANQPDGLRARGVKIVRKRRTSGSTGIPTVILRGPATERRIFALKLRRMFLTGVRGWEKAVYLPYWGSDASASAALNGPKVGRTIGNLSSVLSRPRDLVAGYRVLPLGPGNIAVVSSMVVNYRPSILRSRPSYLRRVAKFAKERDPNFTVRKIFTEGEVLTAGTRKDLQSTFGAEVFDEYGAAEFSGLGFECKSHCGMHLYSDYFAFEFLASDGLPAAEGERAEIVITGLVDDAMPLVRYRIGDYVIKEKEELCQCGLYLPRLRMIEGRTVDGLATAGGEPVPSGAIVDHFETVLGLRDFQLVQEGEHEFTLKVRGEVNSTLIQSAESFLTELLHADVAVKIERWGDSEMPMKFRPVVNVRPTAPLTSHPRPVQN